MSYKGKIEPYTFRLLMPKRCDLESQIRQSYKNIGFDSIQSKIDTKTKIPMISLARQFPEQSTKSFLWEILLQNKEIREWLKHLFASDYHTLASNTRRGPWQHSATFPRTDDFDFEVFNEKAKGQKSRSPIATEEHNGLTVVRIQGSSYERLHRCTREKINAAFQKSVLDPALASENKWIIPSDEGSSTNGTVNPKRRR